MLNSLTAEEKLKRTKTLANNARIRRRKKKQAVNKIAKNILQKNKAADAQAIKDKEEALAQDQNPHTQNMQIHQAQYNNKQVSVWDSVPVCTTACVAYASCPKRVPEDIMTPPKCIVRVRYIENALAVLQKCIIPKDELTTHKIGMMLIPLYNQLCSFKIAEIGMNADNKVLHGTKVNPIYKEMRATIICINKIINDLNGSLASSGRSKKNVNDKETYGDRDYYKTILGEEE